VDYPNAKKDPREKLLAAGATEEECSFLVSDRPGGGWSGRRVEMNAFTAPRWIEFLEHKFKLVGVTKVVPASKSLESAFCRAWMVARIQEAVDKAAREAAEGDNPAMPRGLASRVARVIKDTGQSWDEALSGIVREMRAKQASER
jgi:hypothetical protein